MNQSLRIATTIVVAWLPVLSLADDLVQLPAILPKDQATAQVSAPLVESVFKWTGPKGDQCGKFKVSADGQSSSFSEMVDQKSCLTKDLTFFQWSDTGSKKCLAYSSCNTRIGYVDVSFCQGKENNFAKKWPARGYTWINCYMSGTGTTIPFDKNGRQVRACAPDTLYTWHKHSDMEKFYIQPAKSKKGLLPLNNYTLFTWRTPIGSFGYGNQGLRLKLKTNVKFKYIDKAYRDCAYWKASSSNTVFVANAAFGNDDYSEYFICSQDVLESWSYDTAFQLTENYKEITWIVDHANDDKIAFDSLSGTTNQTATPWNLPQDWDTRDVRATNWSSDALNYNNNEMKKAIALDQGQVFFARDVVPSLWNHFSTAHTGYFNYYDGTQIQETWPERKSGSCQMTKN